MLQDMSMLSDISTLDKQSPIQHDRERLKPKLRLYNKELSADKSKSKSTNLSNSNSIINFNFKKNKGTAEKFKTIKDTKKLVLRDKSKDKEIPPEAGRISPKFNSTPGETQFLKSRSIFSVSSFGAFNKNADFGSTINKKEPFKQNI